MTRRQVPEGIRTALPVKEAYSLIKAQEKEIEKIKKGYLKQIKTAEELIVETALQLFRAQSQISQLPESGKALFMALERNLKSRGVLVKDYAGERVDEELLSKVRVEGWEEGTGEFETVKETFTPEISWNGNVLHVAQVFCYKAVHGKEIEEEGSEQEADALKEDESIGGLVNDVGSEMEKIAKEAVEETETKEVHKGSEQKNERKEEMKEQEESEKAEDDNQKHVNLVERFLGFLRRKIAGRNKETGLLESSRKAEKVEAERVEAESMESEGMEAEGIEAESIETDGTESTQAGKMPAARRKK